MKKHYTLFHLDGERGFRGGERQLLYLAAHLREEGHDNIIVCRSGYPLAKESARQGFKTLKLPYWTEWDPLSAWKLHRAAADASAAGEKPAILHAHTGHTAMLASFASWFGGHPWVAHRRVDFPLGSPLSRRIKYDSAGKVIAVSENIRTLLCNAGVKPEQIDVIPDALPQTEHEAEIAGSPHGPIHPARNGDRASARKGVARRCAIVDAGPWIGNLAALVPHKDPQTLIRSAPAVLREYPEARFFLVGEGPLENELRALARALAVDASVIFTGYQKNPQTWLHAFDVYVQSSWGEGMGSVLLEAMACELPIVATTAGGIPEVVTHERSALLVEPRSPEDLAAAIITTLKNKDAARERVNNATQDLKRFSLTRMGRRMQEVYDGL